MSLPSVETQARVASDAATVFVDHFYELLNNRRFGSQLAQNYASASARLTAAGVKPDISINGFVLASVAELETLLETQGGPVSYDVQSFDAHPVNPNYAIGAPPVESAHKKNADDSLSFVVQVSGLIRYGKGEDADVKAFNESLLLVPHVFTDEYSKVGGTRTEPATRLTKVVDRQSEFPGALG